MSATSRSNRPPPFSTLCGIFLFIVFFVVAGGVGSAVAQEEDGPVVNTTYGPVRGFYQSSAEQGGNLTRAFLGVPFAAPPARFAAATAPATWTEAINATTWPAPCVQPASSPNPNRTIGSEDCLYLNVFTPRDAQAGDDLPVMVYVHGGRYWTGESAQYAGQWLSGNGRVVLVTIQYRLNIFGFFALPELEANNSLNLGLLDQRLALYWVRDNIAAFGGNPDQVTLFGESAGAGSALLHLMVNPPGESVRADQLFKRVILQSAWQWVLPTLDRSKAASLSWSAQLGCNQSTTAEVLACMRDLPADSISPLSTTPQINYFQPLVDGDFLEDQPLVLIKKGRYATNVTVVMGFNADEGNFMASTRLGFKGPTDNITQSDFLTGAKNRSLAYWLTEAEMNQVIGWYSASTAKLGYWYGLAKILGDFYIICPSILAAPYLVDRAVDETIYTYVWNHTSVNNANQYAGAAHGNELVYVFNSTVYTPGYNLSAVDLALSYRMIQSWSTIARQGAPQAGWPAHNATETRAFLWQQSTVDYDPAQAATIPFAQLSPLCGKWAAYFNVSSTPANSGASSLRSFFSLVL